jgi:uncharacterized protein with GYD domain
MFTYVSLIKFTDQGLRTIKESVARSEGGRQAIEQAGGRVLGLYWTQGQYDVVVLSAWPDEESAMAVTLLVGMAGNDRIETLRAFTAEQMQTILHKLP